MSEQAVTTALVLAGGPVRLTPRLRRLTRGADLVIAADGGLRHAAELDLRPDLLVGDFDSLDDAVLASHAGVPEERHPIGKDVLDLELAIDAAVARGARHVRVVGAFGGRLDQTLAAATIALRYAQAKLRIALLDGPHELYPLVSGDRFEDVLPDGTVFSLIAVSDRARVDVRGAAYPLAAAELPRGVGLGLSNVARHGPTVDVAEGAVLLIVEWDA